MQRPYCLTGKDARSVGACRKLALANWFVPVVQFLSAYGLNELAVASGVRSAVSVLVCHSVKSCDAARPYKIFDMNFHRVATYWKAAVRSISRSSKIKEKGQSRSA